MKLFGKTISVLRIILVGLACLLGKSSPAFAHYCQCSQPYILSGSGASFTLAVSLDLYNDRGEKIRNIDLFQQSFSNGVPSTNVSPANQCQNSLASECP